MAPGYGTHVSEIGNPPMRRRGAKGHSAHQGRSVYRCAECGDTSPKWVGRCPGCEQWNTLHEEVIRPAGSVSAPRRAAVPITDVAADDVVPLPTGLEEVDRVLCGGLVPGSVTLIGGEPGVGKSTLLLQMVGGFADRGGRCLYVSAEESAQQVRQRAERLGVLHPSILLAAETSLPELLGQLEEVRPTVAVIDSIQTVADPDLGSAPGSVTQVRECAHRLVEVAKSTGVAVVLVGHVTKEGSLAGPRVLEHVVDTVLSFEGDRHHSMRLLRATKHRYGSTQELGLTAMGERGLETVADPSAMFLADRRLGVPGSVVVPTVEGRRPLLVELQALASVTGAPQPRRSAQGVDSGRIGMLLAVLATHLGISVSNFDVFTLAVGGARVTEPGADLPLALAILSSVHGHPIPPRMVACGEVGLAGELRSVEGMARRLGEAARHGFTAAVVPASTPDVDLPIQVMRVPSLDAAAYLLGLGEIPSSRG